MTEHEHDPITVTVTIPGEALDHALLALATNPEMEDRVLGMLVGTKASAQVMLGDAMKDAVEEHYARF